MLSLPLSISAVLSLFLWSLQPPAWFSRAHCPVDSLPLSLSLFLLLCSTCICSLTHCPSFFLLLPPPTTTKRRSTLDTICLRWRRQRQRRRQLRLRRRWGIKIIFMPLAESVYFCSVVLQERVLFLLSVWFYFLIIINIIIVLIIIIILFWFDFVIFYNRVRFSVRFALILFSFCRRFVNVFQNTHQNPKQKKFRPNFNLLNFGSVRFGLFCFVDLVIKRGKNNNNNKRICFVIEF